MEPDLRAKAAVMVLSDEATLIYILAGSGVRGRLNSGRIERGPGQTLDVFDRQGKRFDYLAGKIRSWCVVDAAGTALDGWHEILPEDLPRIFSRAF